MNRIRTSKGSAILEDLLICFYSRFSEGLGSSNLRENPSVSDR